MKFNSAAGQELRTWILFFVGIGLAVIFAFKGNPLSHWWTLIIGAFTCTAIIVSAVQALAGGMTDAAKKAVEETKRNDSDHGSKKPPPPPLPFALGTNVVGLVRGFRRDYPYAI